MNIKINPITNRMYAKYNNSNNPSNTNNNVVSVNNPAFCSKNYSKAMRNMMLGLAAVVTVPFVSCSNYNNNTQDKDTFVISSLSDMRNGLKMTDSIGGNGTKDFVQYKDADNSQVTKFIDESGCQITIINKPDSTKIVHRELSNSELGGYEEKIYNKSGGSEYKFFATYTINNDNNGFETYYERRDKNGELLCWEDRTMNNPNASISENGIAFCEIATEKEGCKRILEYDEYGRIEDEYFISKSGQKTSAETMYNIEW